MSNIFYSVIFALILAATSMSEIAMQMVVVTKASSAANELFNIIDRESAVDPMSDAGCKPDTCKGNIEVGAVTFAYPSRPESCVLKDLILKIPAN